MEKELKCPFCGAPVPYIRVYLPTMVSYHISDKDILWPHYDVRYDLGDFNNHIVESKDSPSFFRCDKCDKVGTFIKNGDGMVLSKSQDRVPDDAASYSY